QSAGAACRQGLGGGPARDPEREGADDVEEHDGPGECGDARPRRADERIAEHAPPRGHVDGRNTDRGHRAEYRSEPRSSGMTNEDEPHDDETDDRRDETQTKNR